MHQLTERQPASPKRSRSLVRSIATITPILASLAILLALGTWQMERLHWKEGLLADIAERRSAVPVELSEIERLAASGGDIEYRRVALSGTFDHTKERHFFATFQGQTGFYVYTPLILSDGRALLVNRGFIPYEMKEVSTRTAGEVTREQRLTGYARSRLAQKPSSIVPDNDIAKNIFFWKDLDVMASSSGLDPAKTLPFFVDVDDLVQNPGGWPKGGVTQFDLPNSHLQYAFTWYGLAAALVAVVIGAWWRRAKPATP